MTVQKQVAATVALGKRLAGGYRKSFGACSVDGGPRIVSCHHTVEVYRRKDAFLTSEISGVCEVKIGK